MRSCPSRYRTACTCCPATVSPGTTDSTPPSSVSNLIAGELSSTRGGCHVGSLGTATPEPSQALPSCMMRHEHPAARARSRRASAALPAERLQCASGCAMRLERESGDALIPASAQIASRAAPTVPPRRCRACTCADGEPQTMRAENLLAWLAPSTVTTHWCPAESESTCLPLSAAGSSIMPDGAPSNGTRSQPSRT